MTSENEAIMRVISTMDDTHPEIMRRIVNKSARYADYAELADYLHKNGVRVQGHTDEDRAAEKDTVTTLALALRNVAFTDGTTPENAAGLLAERGLRTRRRATYDDALTALKDLYETRPPSDALEHTVVDDYWHTIKEAIWGLDGLKNHAAKEDQE